MYKRKEKSTVFLIGSVGYGILEILWRGYTHWSMLLTGGVCFRFLYRLNCKTKIKNKFAKAALSAGIITTIEFVSGCIFNKLFKLKVWDYSMYRGNLLGQICPLYCALWFFLSFPVNYLCNLIKTKILS